MSTFDKYIAKAGKILINNMSSVEIGNIDIKFSKRHQQQMQKMFEKYKMVSTN